MKKIKYVFVILGLFLMMQPISYAQGQRTVKGTVKDTSGLPVPGAVVLVSGTSQGTSTDADGHYSINVKGDNVTLEFSCIGYVAKAVAVGNRGEIDVILEDDALLIEETIVVGYGTQRKVDLTGAVEQVNSEVFNARPNANVTQMLEGAVPNLNISLADGKPIRTADFNVRGTTSIGQGGSALILVDGVEGDPSMLNPNDIESVSVLKDAASAAIYGSRAPYGVVLITTKNAKKGKTVVNYSNNLTFSSPVVKPQYVTDGFTWASMMYQAYYNFYGSRPTDMNMVQTFSTGWLMEYRRRHDTGEFGTIVSDGSWRTHAGEYVYFPEGTDWFGILYKDVTMGQTHNLSISGSSDKFDYYLSGRIYGYYGLYDTEVNTDDCHSQNFRVKVGYQAYPWLRLTNNFEMGHRKYNNPITSAGAAGNIWAQINACGAVSVPMYNPDGTMTQAAAYSVGGFLYGNSKNMYENDDVKNTVGFTASLLDNAFTVNGDATYKLTESDGIIRKYPDTFSEAPGVLETRPGLQSSITEDRNKIKYMSANLYADYTREFGNHYIKGLVGYNYEQWSSSKLHVYNTDLLSETVDNINLTFGTEDKKMSETWKKWRSVGLFSRINYSYAERYLLQFNGRYDGSSKFPANERWAFFPSLSAGWRLSEEPFIKDNISKKWLSNAKFRMSYGSLGNSNVSPYYYDETLSIGNSRLLNGTKYRKTEAPDPIPDNLTWETSKTYNGGIDLGFFEDRFTITADTYLRRTEDMFTDGPTIQAVYGADAPKGNYAELSTRGLELTILWKNGFVLAGKPFNYSVKGTLADYVSTVDKFNNETKYIGGRNWAEYYEGQTIGEIWGFVSYGLWQTQEEIDAAEAAARAAGATQYDAIHSFSNDKKLHPGDTKIEDIDGNGYITRGDQTAINPGDRTIIGNSEPRYIWSFNFSADWNNFYASIFFQGVGKQDFYSIGDSGMIWGQYNRPYNMIPKWQLGQFWTEENRDAWLPRYTAKMEPFAQGSRRGNSRYLFDISYIRLKNVQFGYNIPEKWLKPLNISKASIFFSGENLWDWSPMYRHAWGTVDVLALGQDPENSDTTAGTGGCYPIMKSFSFGVNVSF